MIRFLLYLVLAVFAITLLRMVIGFVVRGASTLLGGGPSQPARSASAGGELKRDPVCGTYVSTAASVKKTVGAEVLHFCSTGCRDKYSAAS